MTVKVARYLLSYLLSPNACTIPHCDASAVRHAKIAQAANILLVINLSPVPLQSARELRGGSHRGVHLGTIHSSKGLEWHTVFVMRCNDGELPGNADDFEKVSWPAPGVAPYPHPHLPDMELQCKQPC